MTLLCTFLPACHCVFDLSSGTEAPDHHMIMSFPLQLQHLLITTMTLPENPLTFTVSDENRLMYGYTLYNVIDSHSHM